MIRRSDVLFGAVAAGLTVVILAAVWPRNAGEGDSPVRLSGATITSPQAGDWIAGLSGRLEQRERPVRQETPEQSPLAGYELIGLVETGEAQWALIAGNGESHTLELGDGLDGYELVQILADRVVFAQDGDQVVLELRR